MYKECTEDISKVFEFVKCKHIWESKAVGSIEISEVFEWKVKHQDVKPIENGG